jgi:hypothetical protein
VRQLKRVVPNESWQLVIEFDGGEHRLFDASVAREEMGWPALAYPNRLKHFFYDASSVTWPGIGDVTAAYLHQKSVPLGADRLERQVLRLSYKNQAPTDTHPTHHVYEVCIFPFSRRLFSVGESIGGGHGEMGGSRELDLAELLAWPEWKRHFERSGATWAIPLVDANPDDSTVLSDALTQAICARE